MIEITIVAGLGCWSIGLVLLKLCLWPSFIRNKRLRLFLDLDIGALNLSFWSWACDPASFLITNHSRVGAWMSEQWTCPFEARPEAQLQCQSEIIIVSGLGCWSIGLVLLRIGLRPGLIFKTNHYCLWTWMLGHWSCPCEAGSSFLIQHYDYFWTWML